MAASILCIEPTIYTFYVMSAGGKYGRKIISGKIKIASLYEILDR
jgi:hypothetical protein